MSNEELENIFTTELGVSSVQVTGDGYHFKINIIATEFEGLSKVKRQQWVYSKVKSYITNGSLHALTINALTPKEAETING